MNFPLTNAELLRREMIENNPAAIMQALFGAEFAPVAKAPETVVAPIVEAQPSDAQNEAFAGVTAEDFAAEPEDAAPAKVKATK